MKRPSRAPSSRAPGNVRIIGGRWKRRLLTVVDAPGLRPTPARVRETLFNWIHHAFESGLDGLSVLDLFAGSGALGLESASRGASPVILVEVHPGAVRNLRAMIESLGARQVEVKPGDGVALARALSESGATFDLVFLDPPFGEGRLADALPLAAALINASGLIYVEAGRALEQSEIGVLGLETYRADKAGEVFYHLLRRNIKER